MTADGTKLTSEQLYDRLRRLADGLLYPSEIDAPVDVFFWDTSLHGELTIDALIETYHLPDDAPVSSVPPEEFFEGVTETYEWHTPEEREASERFQQAQELFFANVTNPKHYWIGEHKVHVFLWGRTVDGNYVGFQTRLVET